MEPTTERGACSKVSVLDPNEKPLGRPKRVSWNLSTGPEGIKKGSVAICVELSPLEVSPVVRMDSRGSPASEVSSLKKPNPVKGLEEVRRSIEFSPENGDSNEEEVNMEEIFQATIAGNGFKVSF